MAVLCDLGLHKPAPWPRWNLGYYFTKCERCDEDLVRTAFGSWQIPRGFRVRWQASPPEKAHLQSGAPPLQPEEATAEVPPAAPEPDAQPEPEQPLVDIPEAPPVIEEPEPPAAPEPPKPPPPSRIPDFMADASDQAAATASAGADADPTAAARQANRDEPTASPSRAMLPMLTSPTAPTTPAPEGGFPHAAPVIGFFLIVIVAALALALVRWPSMRGEGSAPDGANAAATASPSPLPQTAFRVAVEASLLNCRAAPALEAAVLQRLGYGETVQLIERGAIWANVDTGRRQCWVPEQYLSAPLDL